MAELTTQEPLLRRPMRAVQRASHELSEVPKERQAYFILRAGFAAAPLIAGADKFFNVLCRWEKYLAPQVAALLPMSPRTFMRGVGVVELAAGALVAIKPRVGSYLVAGWLGGIIANLLLAEDHYDIALRDLGLALGALALGRLSELPAPAELPAMTP